MERRLGQRRDVARRAARQGRRRAAARTSTCCESAGDTRPDVRAEGDEFRALLARQARDVRRDARGRELTIFRERCSPTSRRRCRRSASSYGISRERARQLEKRLTDKLQEVPGGRARRRGPDRHGPRRMSDETRRRPTARRTGHALRRADADRQPRGPDAARGARAQGGRRSSPPRTRARRGTCLRTSRSRGRPCVSFFEGNEAARTEHLLARLRGGERRRGDLRGGHAGRLRSGRAAGRGGGRGGRARRARCPGASAALAALVGVGAADGRVHFVGFPARDGGPRRRRSRGCAASRPRWSSTRRPAASARRCTIWRPRSATSAAPCVARELTKVHEELVRGTLNELAARYADARAARRGHDRRRGRAGERGGRGGRRRRGRGRAASPTASRPRRSPPRSRSRAASQAPDLPARRRAQAARIERAVRTGSAPRS